MNRANARLRSLNDTFSPGGAKGALLRRLPLMALAVAALAVSLLTVNLETVGAQEPPDDYTMNDIWDVGSYGRVSVGSAGEGSIEKSGDRDFFALDLSEPGTYRIEVTGSGDADALANPRLQGLFKYAEDQECSGAYDDPAVRSYAFTADTTNGNVYSVGVGAEDDGTGSYRLTITKTDDTATGCETVQPETEPQAANSPATGAPVITGTTQVGETLTVNTSGVADEDGLDNAVFSYQWLSDDTDISGATDSTYTLVDSDEGTAISVTVTLTDDAGNEETLTSAVTAAVEAKPNSPATGAPSISGTAQVGETLTADTSGIADEDGLTNATFSYQWLADDADIAGATSATYTLSDSDVGKTITVQASFTDDAGHDEMLTSDATAAAEPETQEAQANNPATGLPAITGTAQVGETLTADPSGIADEDGLDNAVFSYQWLADDADISGATDDTYTLADSDEGTAISVTVTFTDDAGNEETLTSAVTAAVEAKPNSPATGLPSISGTTQVGETLTADTSGIEDEDGLTNAAFAFQWLADGADITGATDSTYTLANADEGTAISVRVSFTDDSGNEESLTSAATITAPTRQRANAQTDNTAPTISSIAITSDPDEGDADYGPYFDRGWSRSSWPSGIYGIGDAVQVTVTFSEDVSVTGQPQLQLDVGGTARSADYERVEGSSVVFSYTVVEGDSDTDGIGIGASELTLNGGSIEDAASNSANLSHDSLASQSGHKVDGIRPRLLRVGGATGFGSSNGRNGFYRSGDEVLIEARFSERIRGSSTNPPQLTMDFDGEARMATWNSEFIFGEGFYYVIQEGDLDVDGVAVAADSVVLNGGFFKDEAGNDAVLTQGAAHFAVRVDAVAPTVSSIAITSDPGDDGTYVAGDLVEVTVTFSEPVETWVSSALNPQVELDIGGEARTADRLPRGARGAEVVFAYTVQNGDGDDDGIAIGANKIIDAYLAYSSGGGFGLFIDAAGNSAKDLTHDALADDPNHKVAGGSSPLAIGGDSTVNYWENGDEKVAYYNVLGSDGDITWSLTGDDSDDFTISSVAGGRQGHLWFQSPPNYEDPTDANTDNLYRVRLHASDGENEASLQVIVMVINQLLDDDEVPVIVGTAEVGQTLTADVSRLTNEEEATFPFNYWWIRIDGTTDTTIDGATESSYTLTAADIGKSIKVQVWSVSWIHIENWVRTSEATATVAAAQLQQPGNSPATGAPTISGTAQVGEMLTADVSGIADADGLSNASFSYQWLVDDADISGASDSTYTLTDADEGRSISVRVSFTDDAGYEESLTSAATSAVEAKPNAPATGLPSIIGTAQVGETLMADTSGIADADGLSNAVFSYQWLADGSDISGASDSAHRLTDAYEDKAISVTVSFTDDTGNEESLTSAATDAVASAPASPLTASLENAPAAHDGSSAFTFDLRFSEELSVSYRTLRDHAFTVTGGTVRKAGRLEQGSNSGWRITVQPNINGEVTVILPVTTDCTNQGAICTEDGRKLSSRLELTVSGPESQQPVQNSPATGAPTITGTARVGETLTADASGIVDEDGLTNVSFGYQWVSNDGNVDTDIQEGTASTYTLSDADEGRTIKVTVSFTDDAGNDETLTSTATVEVEARPNSPATGQPTINGTALEGETLMADTSGIADEDGLTNVSFGYQWISNDGGADSEIGGGTGPTYTLDSRDVGKTVEVRVSFTDDRGHGEELTSAATAAVEALEPDLAYVAMLAFAGAWGTYPSDTITLSAKVRNDGNGTSPATTLRYYQSTDETIEASDTEVGTEAVPELTASASFDGGVVEVTAPSSPGTYYYGVCVDAVAGESDTTNNCSSSGIRIEVLARNTAPTGLPSISGTAQVGETLTADVSGIADADGLTNTSFAFQWLADDAEISGATNGTYTPTEADEGTTISVTVSFTDAAGNAETLTSAATAAVEARPNSPATGEPNINGTAQVGETLKAETSGIADADGLDNASFSYQWLADNTDLPGATGSTYTVAGADEGKAIVVKVSFTDDRGHGEELSSAATAAVKAKANSPATGAPAVTGTAQVGETLSTDTSGIADADGLTNASFDYQWLAGGADISGATDSSYTLADADIGKAISVKVSFTDDAGHQETLTSAATDAVASAPASPLTASLENVATSHDGESAFTFELRFSEEFGISYKTLRDHAFTVTGGTVKKAQRLEQGSNIGWRVTVRPDGNGQVVIVLPETTDCDAQGAICTEDGRKLSHRLELTVSGPGQ